MSNRTPLPLAKSKPASKASAAIKSKPVGFITPEVISVTTVAGGYRMEGVDGIGANAAFNPPTAIFAIPIDAPSRGGALLIPDHSRNSIRCVFPAPPQDWKTAFTELVKSILVAGGALPILPLICIVLEFAIADSE